MCVFRTQNKLCFFPSSRCSFTVIGPNSYPARKTWLICLRSRFLPYTETQTGVWMVTLQHRPRPNRLFPRHLFPCTWTCRPAPTSLREECVWTWPFWTVHISCLKSYRPSSWAPLCSFSAASPPTWCALRSSACSPSSFPAGSSSPGKKWKCSSDSTVDWLYLYSV